MRFGDLEFDPSIGEALKQGKLVIFIGAGVSMGAPANMPDFPELADKIAIAVGESRKENELIERFLGKLHKAGINVHQIAADILDIKEKEPNSLHTDLLRVFDSAQKVRIVTTNFDLFLEVAARKLWMDIPEVFSAPAVPRGRNFVGIVHIHGSTNKPQKMILTDADYGRAYLAEGWVTQFLVDLFYHNTVLFVGYSHNDTVMQYLSRGLPSERNGNRFGLTEDSRTTNWEVLDIPPISFPQPAGNGDFSALINGIHQLADYYASGMTEWQSRIEIITAADPSKSQDIGEQALTILQDSALARLFTKNTNMPRWLIWLDEQNILQELFQPNQLSERSGILALWIADQFVLQHSSVIIQLFTKHGGKLNPTFWFYVCRALNHDNLQMKNIFFKRYVKILLDSIPKGHSYGILWLAEQCAERNDIEELLSIFFAMCNFEITYKCYGSIELGSDSEEYVQKIEAIFRADYYHIEKLWRLLRPHLPEVSDRLIPDLYRLLVNLYDVFIVWDRSNKSFDQISFHRNAIDPDIGKGHNPSTIDIVIDAILDALKWASENVPNKADFWINHFLESNVPILVRIAIYSMGIRTDLSANYLMKWLLEYVDIFQHNAKPEVFSFIKHTYLNASTEMRKKLIDRIIMQKESENGGYSAEEQTDYLHFEWLSWLGAPDLNCPFASKVLSEIKVKHPMWKPNKHPNVLWHIEAGIHTPTSPYTLKELIGFDPKFELENWLNYTGESFDGPSRDGLFREIANACKEDITWGISLFRALSEGSHWNSRLVGDVIWAWNDRGLSNEEWMRIMPLLFSPDLFKSQIHSLSHLVLNSGTKHELDAYVLDEINTLARALWPSAIFVPNGPVKGDWLDLSINHPAGILAEFWLIRLNRFQALSEPIKEPLLKEELNWFLDIISSDNTANAYARCLCARYLETLVTLSPSWTEKHFMPYFTSEEDELFQPVWDGFLFNAVCTFRVIDMLMPAITYLSNNSSRLSPDNIEKFAELLVLLASDYLDNALQDIIPQFFRSGDSVGKAAFFSALEVHLQSSVLEHKEKLWDKWIFALIHRYASGWYGKQCKKSLAALICCLPYLDHFYPLAINEIVLIQISDEFDSIYLGFFEESDLIEHFPAESAELLIYLVPHLPNYENYFVAKIIPRLKDLDEALNDRLIDVILRKGWQHCLSKNKSSVDNGK